MMKRFGLKFDGEGGALDLLRIAAPLIVSYACDTIMLFTDRLFLSRLGGAHMSAAMTGGLSAFMFTTFFVGLIGYTTAMVAQRLGAGKKELCGVITTQGGIVALAAFPLLLLLIPVGKKLFTTFGIDDEQLALQSRYFGLLMLGSALPLLRSTLANFFSGIGRTRLVMLAALVSMLVNVGLNYVLIFGKLGMPKLGISGAAYGTIIASAIGVLVLALSYFNRTNREEFHVVKGLRLHRRFMGELWRLGTPSGIELFLNLLAFTLMITIFHGQGIVVASAITITFNWDMVAFIPLLGINVGVTTLVGRYVGKQDLSIAHRSMKSGLVLACTYVLGLMVLFALVPEPLVVLFRPAETGDYWSQIQPLAVQMVRLISIYLLADALTIVFSGALRGAGDTFWTMILSVGIHWVLTGAAYVGFHIMDLGPLSTWIAVIVLFCLMASVYTVRYYKGNWREKALLLVRES
ncbi:MAG: MATE family efflux transporter [Deltaproteobacteria bacterium]|nr:MATE family efflux transporter [Deltaproteobacteria bacterium]